MSGFLLDTNVLSEFNRRGAPDERVKRWLEAADTESLYASVLTFGEIRLGNASDFSVIDLAVVNPWES